MSHDSFAYYCSFVPPALFLAAVVLRVAGIPSSSFSKFRPKDFLVLAVIALSLAIAILPVHGLPLGRYLIGFNANFSIPLLVLLIDSIARNGFKRELLRACERRALVYSGLIAGLVFYPLALGFGSFDPYVWGWRIGPLFAVSGIGAAILIWRGNRYGLVLLAAIVAWHIGFLESRNYWDYLLDPILFGCGVAIAIRDALRRSQSKAGAHRGADAPLARPSAFVKTTADESATLSPSDGARAG